MPEQIIVEAYNPNWPKIYQEEKDKIYKALGFCTDGGVLYRIEHVGSTSVPNLAAKACIDIAVDAYPMPLVKDKIVALEDIGYKYRGENGMRGREHFTKNGYQVHLHIFSFDNEHWQRHILFRDYLRANEDAKNEYQDLKMSLAKQFSMDRKSYQAGKGEMIARLEQNAINWHIKETAFKPIIKIANELKDLSCRWAIASGWALDMFIGQPSRYHDDVDIVIDRREQLCLQQRLLAKNWQLDFVISGKYYKWNKGEFVNKASHQIHARKEKEFLDILLEEAKDEIWLYRRDNSLTMPYSETIKYFKDIPYRVPEINLLYKSLAYRPKDAIDFKRVFPKLAPKSQKWLKEKLLLTNPKHICLKDIQK